MIKKKRKSLTCQSVLAIIVVACLVSCGGSSQSKTKPKAGIPVDHSATGKNLSDTNDL